MKSEIEQRLSYYGLPSHGADLRRVGRRIAASLDGALAKFYGKIQAEPELSGMFAGGEQMGRAKSAQKVHWQKLFEDGLNDTYYKRASVIGNTHARIGLKPKWYIGGYATVMEVTIMVIVAPGLSRFLPWRRRQAQDVTLLVKAAMFDMDIALSTYFDKTEEDTRIVVDKMGDALSQLATGNLTARMPGLPREFAKAEQDFNAALDALQETMKSAVEGIRSISTASSEIRAATDDFAMRNEQQAAKLEETSAAMNQVTDTVQASAARAEEVQQTIAGAHSEAVDGGAVVRRAIQAMDEIERSAAKINEIINVIDGIAFQTNLLALNAGVEAARAGDAGKGFAVVATEVRALAQRSADAAKDIKELITASTQQVSGGVKLVGETGELLDRIVNRVGEINELVAEIAGSTKGQATNLRQINGAVSEMDSMTQQNAAMVEQSTAATRSLADDAGRVAGIVGQFQVGESESAKSEPPKRRRTSAAAPMQVSGNLALKSFAATDDWSEF